MKEQVERTRWESRQSISIYILPAKDESPEASVLQGFFSFAFTWFFGLYVLYVLIGVLRVSLAFTCFIFCICVLLIWPSNAFVGKRKYVLEPVLGASFGDIMFISRLR